LVRESAVPGAVVDHMGGAVTGSPPAPEVAIATTSPPAQKAGPAASRITAPTDASAVTSCAMSRHSAPISKSIAFRDAGRLNVTRARAPSRVRRIESLMGLLFRRHANGTVEADRPAVKVAVVDDGKHEAGVFVGAAESSGVRHLLTERVLRGLR